MWTVKRSPQVAPHPPGAPEGADTDVQELYFVEVTGCLLVTRWLPSVDRKKKPPGSPGATYLAEAVLKMKKIAFGLSIYYPSLYQGQP